MEETTSKCQAEYFLLLDFNTFQFLLLNKEVKLCVDTTSIKSLDKVSQCLLETIRILRDPFSGSRHILYYHKTNNQKHGFAEWPGLSHQLSSNLNVLTQTLNSKPLRQPSRAKPNEPNSETRKPRPNNWAFYP